MKDLDSIISGKATVPEALEIIARDLKEIWLRLYELNEKLCGLRKDMGKE